MVGLGLTGYTMEKDISAIPLVEYRYAAEEQSSEGDDTYDIPVAESVEHGHPLTIHIILDLCMQNMCVRFNSHMVFLVRNSSLSNHA